MAWARRCTAKTRIMWRQRNSVWNDDGAGQDITRGFAAAGAQISVLYKGILHYECIFLCFILYEYNFDRWIVLSYKFIAVLHFQAFFSSSNVLINKFWTSLTWLRISRKEIKKSIHFCDWSTLNLIYILHIMYSFTPPSFEFPTNSESDQLHFHTKIIFFFFPLFTYFLFWFISLCLFQSHLCLLLK
jgi:hypothetical protein